MIARLVEDWLTKVNERQLEVPFTYLLLSKGHKVIHLSRHGEMEQGKDIISVSPDGIACAFQLKTAGSGRIRQSDWDEFLPQIGRLVELPIKHPSIPSTASHNPFLVTNGELDESVRIEIVDRNNTWKAKYGRTLQVIVKGEILRDLLALQTDFWPKRPTDIKTLLEHFLASGTAPIDKASLFNLLWDELASTVTKQETVVARAIASTAILCAYALAPYAGAKNHLAVAEGWVLFIGTVLGLAEKHNLDLSLWSTAVEIAENEAFGSLGNLWEEVQSRKNLFEGNVLVEAVHEVFYRARTTLVLGFLSAWALMKLGKNGAWDRVVTALERFERGLWLWGESGVPHFLAWFWLKGRARGGIAVESILLRLIASIVAENGPKSQDGLPDPYHAPEEVISRRVISRRGYDEFFRLRSYSLESLIHLAATRLWRQRLASLWPGITHITFEEFEPAESNGFYRWHCEEGNLRTRVPRQPESWTKLREASLALEETRIPGYLRSKPSLLPLFVLVYPHRLGPDVAKFLDKWVRTLDA